MKGICVGLGVRGKAWYQWAQQAGLDVVGVVDKDRRILNRACDELEIPKPMRHTCIRRASAETGAKVATVCTANADHAQCVDACLEAGLHVMVEKPMVERAAEARRLIAKAKDRSLHIAVSQNYRYRMDIRSAYQSLQKHIIGQIISLHVDFARWRPAPGMTLPLMLNQGIHHFDAMRYLLHADPQWCFARSWNLKSSPSEGPTLLEAMWGFGGPAEQILATYSGSYVSQGEPTPFSGRWRIEGTTGRLEFCGDPHATIVVTHREGAQREQLPLVREELPESAELLREFLNAIEHNRASATDATDNIKSLAMVWAAEQSSAQNRMVRIDEVT